MDLVVGISAGGCHEASSPVKVNQIEKNVNKLTNLYNEGYNAAKDSYEKVIEFINK